MSAAPRRRRRDSEELLDVELADLPLGARWREWMLRIKAAIFASPSRCRAKPSFAWLVRTAGSTI